jgi:hypothetical protein
MFIPAPDEPFGEAGFLGGAAFVFDGGDFVGAAGVIPFMPGIARIARRAESARAAESRRCLPISFLGCCATRSRALKALSITASSPMATRVAARADRAVVVLYISHLSKGPTLGARSMG